jgi:outer membrane protein OmpA-like peptidoglycan-associated protein
MKGSGKVIGVAVVWILVSAAGAGVYRLFQGLRDGEEKTLHLRYEAEYDEIQREASRLGVELAAWPEFEGKSLPISAYKVRVELARDRLEAWRRYRSKYLEVTARGLVLPNLAPTTETAVIAAEIQTLERRLAVLPKLTTLKLSLDSFSGYFLFRSERFRQELQSEGLSVKLEDDGADYKTRLRRLQSGDSPLAVFTIGALLKVSATLPPCAVILVLDETRGADAMVAYESALANIDALNHPEVRIVLTPDSPSETLARVVRAYFDLPELRPDGFEFANGAREVYNNLRAAGQSGGPPPKKAYVLWEPYVSQALEQPGVHRITDSGKFQGYIVDVLVASQAYLRAPESRKHVLGFVKAYLRTRWRAFEGSDPPHSISPKLLGLVSKDAESLGETLTSAQVLALAQGIRWKNTVENYRHFDLDGAVDGGAGKAGPFELTEIIKNIARVLVDTGAIERDPTGGNPEQLFDSGVVAELQKTNFYPGPGGGGETLPEEEKIPPLSEEQVARLVDVGLLRVENLGFSRGGARLTRQSQRVLRKLAQDLRSWTGYYLLVKGSARADGDPDANRKLAQSRADAAREYLVRQGVEAARVYAVTMPAGSGGGAQSVAFDLAQLPY